MSEWHDPVEIKPVRESLPERRSERLRNHFPSQTGSRGSRARTTYSKCVDSLSECGLELTYGMHSSTGFSPSTGGGSPLCTGPRSM